MKKMLFCSRSSAITFFLLLIALAAHSADSPSVHSGDTANHLAVIELIEEKKALKSNGNAHPGSEKWLKHICDAYLTDQHLIVSGKHAKKIRSHLYQKYAVPSTTNTSNLTRKVLKIFTPAYPRGASYLRELPEEYLDKKWQDNEVVEIPIKRLGNAVSTWTPVRSLDSDFNSRHFSLYHSSDRKTSLHLSGNKERLNLHFRAILSGDICTLSGCKENRDFSHRVALSPDDPPVFLGLTQNCAGEKCSINNYTRLQSQFLYDLLYLGIIAIILEAVLIFAAY